MLNVTLEVTLRLAGPVLSKATAAGAIGIDAPAAKIKAAAAGNIGVDTPAADVDEHLFLPFSLVQGRLRQSLKELYCYSEGALENRMEDLLGPDPNEAAASNNYNPVRGRLRFSDFVCQDTASPGRLRYRIRMDAGRGAADKGALQCLESPIAPGSEVPFVGTISYVARGEQEAADIHRQVSLGLRWTPSFGSGRTFGFGRLRDVTIVRSDRDLSSLPAADTAPAGDVFGIELEIHQPFCVAKRRTVGNLFESDVVISGRVLRGALANALRRMTGMRWDQTIDDSLPAPWAELGRNFNLLRFSHVFPSESGTAQRPVVAPLSLVKVNVSPVGAEKDERLFDVALLSSPCLVGEGRRAPDFAVDWKDEGDVKTLFGWPKWTTELRVRTAIDSRTRRAEEEHLFAYECIKPQGQRWLGWVDVSAVPDADRTAVKAQLLRLGAALSIGKTEATADLRPLPLVNRHFSSRLDPSGGPWAVTLQTPALLCDPSRLNETSGEKQLKDAYEAAWNDISEQFFGGNSREVFKIPRFYAKQSLAGGYLSYRYQPGRNYNPFLLTDAGSVFVLEPAGNLDDARKCLLGWLKSGLPLPQWAVRLYGAEWQTCPYLPEDGFGEIAVNLPCHLEMMPPKEVRVELP